MAELNPQPLPPRSITVHVPPSVLYDIEAFQKVQRSVLGRAGCPGCTSGGHFIWQAYEEFVVTPSLEVRPLMGGAPLEASESEG
jgi:hypothetical protein